MGQVRFGSNLRPLGVKHGLSFLFLSFLAVISAPAEEPPLKNVLIVVEGSSEPRNLAMGGARQLATLMGHFNTKTAVTGVDRYSTGDMNAYDVIFYFGDKFRYVVPWKFTNDVMQTTKPVIWLNSGFMEFSEAKGVRDRFGFFVAKIDTTSLFESVKSAGKTFAKGDVNINLIEFTKKDLVTVLATAHSSRTKKEVPYIVQSKNLMYVADLPMSYTGDSDRYLLFADMLHDILNEQHEESHTALIRIEDVTPMENPNKLRDIAEILGERDIPFLVGVVPFYVDPGAGIRVSLSDKPEIVDALKYMVASGGTIVMHGVTHQYKGITAADFEFWDESTNKPIKGQTAEEISRKIEIGIQEFMKNGLYPVIWETPHYAASTEFYRTIPKYFSTAMEQRLSIEDFDYSQFFPYVINKDLFGQKLIPENLGYIPLDADMGKSRDYVQALIANARTNLCVRDGFAANFFHAFVNLDLLKELVDGVKGLGYTYVDLKEQQHWVKTKDRVILTGSQSYGVTLDDQYLSEVIYDVNGDVISKSVSEKRIKGTFTRSVSLEPGQLYKAEPVEFREHEPTLAEKIEDDIRKVYTGMFRSEETWKEARVAIIWNHYARGAALNDQASFAAVFRSVNIPVDTIFIGQKFALSAYNLLIVPYASIDSLQESDYDAIDKLLEDGGNVVTDGRNYLAEGLGIKFATSRVKVSHVRDKLFPEERINWRVPELVAKFETDEVDEVFCTDLASGTPLVIGKKVGNGRLLFFGTRFDPHTPLGYSQYPYLLEYVRRYFRLGAVMRREQLEVFFEPGNRRTMSVEPLVKQWVNQGIRIVHVSGWHEYPKYTYDYARLIREAHANGILVYAWIEPPQVSQMFWQEHPQWREKNYKGEDVRPSWRYPMALTEKQCVDTMAAKFRRFVEQYDWDGVNLAELYFEAGKGFDTPSLFTPMHPSAQKEVKQLYNIDLGSIFDPRSEFYWKANGLIKEAIVEYRINTIAGVYETFLREFAAVAASKPGFQIVVTAMDSYGSPELREYIGEDMSRLLALQKKFHFHLNVQDPEGKWSTDPLRYTDIGKQYAKLLGGTDKLLLDLNIFGGLRKPEQVTPFPTLMQTGTESFHLVKGASLGAPRAVIYSESSVNAQDLVFFPYALASNVQYSYTDNGYAVSSPSSFTIRLPKEVQTITLDGVPMSPMRENLFLIPAGAHTVSTNVKNAASFPTYELQTRIMSLVGNLLSVSYSARSVTFEYESDMRAIVSLNREPTSLTLDGDNASFTALKGNDCYSVMLPAGRHTVELVGGDLFAYGVNLTSLWSSTAIAIFGTVAVILLVLSYGVIRVVRQRATR